jgi:Uma2 family endonuclease
MTTIQETILQETVLHETPIQATTVQEETVQEEAVEIKRRRFTVDEYDEMTRIGLFRKNKHIELIEGDLIEMAAMYAPHISTVMRISEVFIERFAKKVNVSIQCPLRLDQHTEPEPDIAVLKRRDDFYIDEKPAAKDALLIVEVADSSLLYDRRIKLPLYGKHGVPEVWIINLRDKVIEASRQPFEKGYRQTTLYQQGDLISAEAFGDIAFSISEMLGKK